MALMTMEPAFGGSHFVPQRSNHSLGLRPTLASLAPEGRSRGLPRAVFIRSLRSTLRKTALGFVEAYSASVGGGTGRTRPSSRLLVHTLLFASTMTAPTPSSDSTSARPFSG